MATTPKMKQKNRDPDRHSGTGKQEMMSLLNQQLADMFDLYSQTKQAHWNVKGEEFFRFCTSSMIELAEELLADIRTQLRNA